MRLTLIVFLLVLQLISVHAYDMYNIDSQDKFNKFLDEQMSMSRTSYQQGTANQNSLVIDGPGGQRTQSANISSYSQLKMLAYSTGGIARMTEVYPDGHQTQAIYQFKPGYNEIMFVGDQPGKHILSFEVNGQISNAVIIEVSSNAPGTNQEDKKQEDKKQEDKKQEDKKQEDKKHKRIKNKRIKTIKSMGQRQSRSQ